MQEKKVQQTIRLKCSNYSNRIFRNHVGTSFTPWAAKAAINTIFNPEDKKRAERELKKGYFSHGFGEGTSDLIGIQKVKITGDMVGKTIGQFVAVEVKDPEHKTNPELLEKQEKFINMIISLGGAAGFASSVEEANNIFDRKV